MSKAFTKESDDAPDDDGPDDGPALPAGQPNYITPAGLKRLQDVLQNLLRVERPKTVEVVAWAAGNGDRSENADYQYGKRRLREIDRRIRFLTKRIDAAEVVDPESPRQGRAATQVFFGATVRYTTSSGLDKVVCVVGLDEVDLDRNYISWLSPLARALTKAGPGDTVVLRFDHVGEILGAETPREARVEGAQGRRSAGLGEAQHRRGVSSRGGPARSSSSRSGGGRTRPSDAPR